MNILSKALLIGAALVAAVTAQTTGRALTNVTPALLPAGSPDTAVQLSYTNTVFSGLSVTALWNGSPRVSKVVSGQISMQLTSADLAAPGLNEITIYDNQTGAMWPGAWKFPVYIAISANDIAYDTQRHVFYASIPSTGGTRGNNVVAIDPDTGDVKNSVFVGSEPDRLAITTDMQSLFIFNDGANSVVRLALDTFRPDPAFSTGGTAASGLNTTPIVSALPGTNTVLVGQNSTYKVFDSGHPRTLSANGVGAVAWTGPNTFVNSSGQLFVVSPSGVSVTATSAAGNGGYVQDLKVAGGRVYFSSGAVYDANNLALLGKFNGSGLVEVDAAVQRAYLLGGGPGSSGYGISAFDTASFVPLGSIAIPGLDNTYGNAISRLLRFGADGIAFSYRVPQSFGSGTDKLYVFHSPMFSAPPAISESSIVNAASNQRGLVSPGEIVTIYGTGLGPTAPRGVQLSTAGAVDTSAGDTRVYFNGIAAPVLFTSAGQVNCVVPYAVSRSSTVSVQVSYLGNLSNSVTLPVQSAFPALFTTDGSGSGQVAAANQDTTFNSAAHPAPRGSVVTLYGTGEGLTNPAGSDGKIAVAPLPSPQQSVKVTIGGFDATVLYAGAAPGLVAGVMQLNVVVPPQAFPGNAVPVELFVGTQNSSGAATLAIQ